MTLQPYDGANRVLLPDGRECWEKENKHFGGSEITPSYQYSIEIGRLPTDYYGRVLNLKVQASDGSWNEIVTFLLATPALMKRLRTVMERGWTQQSEAAADRGAAHSLYSEGYLLVMADILALVESACKS